MVRHPTVSGEVAGSNPVGGVECGSHASVERHRALNPEMLGSIPRWPIRGARSAQAAFARQPRRVGVPRSPPSCPCPAGWSSSCNLGRPGSTPGVDFIAGRLLAARQAHNLALRRFDSDSRNHSHGCKSAADGLLWEQVDGGSSPSTRTLSSSSRWSRISAPHAEDAGSNPAEETSWGCSLEARRRTVNPCSKERRGFDSHLPRFGHQVAGCPAGPDTLGVLGSIPRVSIKVVEPVGEAPA